MFTIQQLINKLQTYDNKDMLVMVEGYESGYQPIEDSSFKLNNVIRASDPSWYDGIYTCCADDSIGSIGTKVLVIER